MGKLKGKDSSTHATSSSTSNPEDWDTRVAAEPLRCLYSYYTAGSGGAGPTILETSFLLAGEGVEAYLDGKKVSSHALCLMQACAWVGRHGHALVGFGSNGLLTEQQGHGIVIVVHIHR